MKNKSSQNSDRRAFVRRAVRQVCQTAVPGLGIVSCIITDYCRVGLFLRFQGRPQHLDEVRNGTDIALSFVIGDTQEKHKSMGTIARVTPTGLGIRFEVPPADLMRALKKIAQGQNQADQSVQYSIPGVPDLLADLAARTRSFGRTCMGDFVVRVGTALSSHALETVDQELVEGFYSARRLLRGHERELLTRFPEQIEEACLALCDTEAVDEMDAIQTPDLTLTDEAEFGHWLSVSELAAKADARYPVQLFDLNRRFNTLADRMLEPGLNPFSPQAVAQLFSDMVSRWPLSTEAFEVIYTAFAKAVIAPWENLVNELNEVLIEHNVQPSVSYGMDAWLAELPETKTCDTG